MYYFTGKSNFAWHRSASSASLALEFMHVKLHANIISTLLLSVILVVKLISDCVHIIVPSLPVGRNSINKEMSINSRVVTNQVSINQ